MLKINTIHNLDCIEGLKQLEDDSVDSIVTDAPYELGFMGKSWDSTGIAYSIDLWKECFRVLKYGGHLLSFGGSRTYHRMACAIEDAGFEIRDQIQWIFGSGFPKSYNISKGIDKKFGADAEIVGRRKRGQSRPNSGGVGKGNGSIKGGYNFGENFEITLPSSDEAKQWDGWGTALKPAHEPIVLARKPLGEKTIVDNILKYGTGGINIDDCRIEGIWSGNPNRTNSPESKNVYGDYNKIETSQHENGRFPANVILDEEAGSLLDKQSGTLKSGNVNPEGFKGKYSAKIYGRYANNQIDPKTVYGDSGGASRFFYCAKASKKERGKYNNHPTVKPIKLMEYLVKLITPPNGIVLDPFVGSGTTMLAAKKLGFNYVGFELEKEYIEIANKRLSEIVNT